MTHKPVDQIIDVDFYREDSTAKHALGTRCRSDLGGEWMYLQADEAITGAGYTVVVASDYGCSMVTTTNANNLDGNLIAVPGMAVTNAYYFWGQIDGPCEGVRVAASCAANVKLNSTATAGVLDDDATSGATLVEGLYTTTADGGSGSAVAATLRNVRLGDEL